MEMNDGARGRALTVMLVFFHDNEKGQRIYGLAGNKTGLKRKTYEIKRHMNLVTGKWNGKVKAAYIHEYNHPNPPDWQDLTKRIMTFANGVWQSNGK
ncbi:hypothetical protein [Xanthocytophaga flava]|uniref:hypothetical protein n=1 Tax=Xanthocytophaga flava TaxID=3048013 RepID=UPI0028D6DBD3|nr:hypothetical protein [Xanthocytophaga flavus]MDJ1472862.1 hypothetical protein [Xanthocytophaga flavus]